MSYQMQYRAEVDGLRALAVVPVILFHAGVNGFSGGYVGVDIFFVISGYLISSIILAELESDTFSIVNFYERRARRILPALFFVMLVCLPFAWNLSLHTDMKDFAQSLVVVPLFLSNFLFWQESGYFNTTNDLKPLLHTWSLAVEEQYYILFPLFLMFSWNLGKRKIYYLVTIILISSLAFSHWSTINNPAVAYYLLPSRVWELLVGVLVAFNFRYFSNPRQESLILRNIGGGLGLLIILYAIVFFNESTLFPGLSALTPTIGAALILLFAKEGTLVCRLLSTKLFVGLGLISYSAYLWHQPLLAFLRQSSIKEPSLLEIGLVVFLTFPLAYFSFLFITIGLLGQLSNGFPNRLPSDVVKIFEVKGWQDNNACFFRFPDINEAQMEECMSNPKKVYLIGDSHAASLSKDLRSQLEIQGYTLVTLVHNACFPIVGTSREGHLRKSSCQSYKEEINNIIVNLPAPTVISTRWRVNLLGKRYDNGEGGIEDGENVLNYVFENTGVDIFTHVKNELVRLAGATELVVVDQIPEAGWDVPSRMAKIKWFGEDANENYYPLSTSYSVYKEENANVINLLKRNDDLYALVVTADFVCSNESGRCLNELDENPLYKDDDHPSRYFTERISEKIISGLSLYP